MTLNLETELKTESPTKFFNDQASDLQIAFEADVSRKAPIAYFIVSGMKKEMKKIIRIVK